MEIQNHNIKLPKEKIRQNSGGWRLIIEQQSSYSINLILDRVSTFMRCLGVDMAAEMLGEDGG